MKEVAEKLGKERQTVNYHLRKKVLEDDFKRLVTDKLKIDFPLTKPRVPVPVSKVGESVFRIEAIVSVLLADRAEERAKVTGRSVVVELSDYEQAVNALLADYLDKLKGKQ